MRPAAPSPAPADAQPPIIPGFSAAKPARPLSRKTVVLISVLALGLFAFFGYQEYDARRFPPGYRNRPASGWKERPGEREFSQANDRIDSFQGTTAFGNTPEATALARQFSETLKAARETMFTKGSPLEGLGLTKGEFLTYCKLHAAECAFIVHVPGLRKYDKDFTQKVDARKLLAQTAWLTAQKVLHANRTGQPDMELAVGLRGISQYSPILLGYYREHPTGPADGIIKYLDDTTQSHFLWAFFAPDAKTEPVQP